MADAVAHSVRMPVDFDHTSGIPGRVRGAYVLYICCAGLATAALPPTSVPSRRSTLSNFSHFLPALMCAVLDGV